MVLRQGLIECERYFIGLKSVNGNTIRYKAFPARCNTWDCAICSRVKAQKYQIRIRPLFESGPLYFYTLTFYHKTSPRDCWANVARVWNRFRTAAVKQFGQINYVRVLEHHHKSPYPHLHIIADKLLPATWLGAEAVRAGFGYQIDSKPVTSKEAAIYVTKYLTKGWTDPFCKSIRKSLRLRVITFGGTLCRAERIDSPWSLIARSLMGDGVVDAILTDVSWTYGNTVELTWERQTEAYIEQTYIIGSGGLTVDECSAILPVP